MVDFLRCIYIVAARQRIERTQIPSTVIEPTGRLCSVICMMPPLVMALALLGEGRGSNLMSGVKKLDKYSIYVHAIINIYLTLCF
jgi:hypothetical protein